MTRNTLLQLSGIIAGYGPRRRGEEILRGIDLTLDEGERLALVGESGSGKSTLAKVISGQLRPYQGQLHYDGTSLIGSRGKQLRESRRRINLVPQDPYGSLNPKMRVDETLAEAINPGAVSVRRDREQIAQLLRSVQLPPDVARRYPHEFSGGQRQRIAIARALAVQPRILIADEVTSALDASVQAEILDLLKSLNQSGLSFIFVTHDLEIAEYLCDSVVVMRAGLVVERGDVTLLQQPETEYTRTLVASVPDPEGRFLDASGSAFGPSEAGA